MTENTPPIGRLPADEIHPAVSAAWRLAHLQPWLSETTCYPDVTVPPVLSIELIQACRTRRRHWQAARISDLVDVALAVRLAGNAACALGLVDGGVVDANAASHLEAVSSGLAATSRRT